MTQKDVAKPFFSLLWVKAPKTFKSGDLISYVRSSMAAAVVSLIWPGRWYEIGAQAAIDNVLQEVKGMLG